MAHDSNNPAILPDQSVQLPTIYGTFTLNLYTDPKSQQDHLALVNLPAAPSEQPHPVLVRIHSECLTGDVLGSIRCDCGHQLEHALKKIAQEGGVLLYLRQEGRGIGLAEKLKAYALQEQGFDTVEANQMLGHQPDARNYQIASQILLGLGIKSINLITNNPAKIQSMTAAGVDVVSRIPSPPQVTDANRSYLETKVKKLNHLLGPF